jgi:hypothetical protein
MERLRVECAGEPLDLVSREGVRSKIMPLADLDVFEECHAGTRLPNMIGFSKTMTGAACAFWT